MTVQQKQAWFTLMVVAVAFVTFFALLPSIGSHRALGAFGICGLVGLPAILSRRRGKAPLMDERDQLINRKAQFVGYRIFWIAFVLVSVIAYEIVQEILHQEVVPVYFLIGQVWFAWVLFMVSSSIAILVQYGRSHDHED